MRLTFTAHRTKRLLAKLNKLFWNSLKLEDIVRTYCNIVYNLKVKFLSGISAEIRPAVISITKINVKQCCKVPMHFNISPFTATNQRIVPLCPLHLKTKSLTLKNFWLYCIPVIYLNVQGQGYYNKMFREEKRKRHRRIVKAFTRSCSPFFGHVKKFKLHKFSSSDRSCSSSPLQNREAQLTPPQHAALHPCHQPGLYKIKTFTQWGKIGDRE